MGKMKKLPLKPSRIIDLKNVKEVKAMPCLVCKTPGPNDCDHIRTRGAGGGDEVTNLWPLCRYHHVERHSMGLKSFVERHKLPISWKNGYPELDLSASS